MRFPRHRGVVEAPRGTGAAGAALRFAHDPRGSAGLELAIGAVVVLGLAATCFAVYSRIEATTSAPRIAVAMAEYVSREAAPDGDQLDALARFLRDHELGTGYAALIVTTAVHKKAGKAAGVRWIDRIALGDETATDELKKICKGKSAGKGRRKGKRAALGEHFAMDDGETVFVVEVCARGGPAPSLPASWVADLYYHYLLPTRHPDVLPEPPTTRTPRGESA